MNFKATRKNKEKIKEEIENMKIGQVAHIYINPSEWFDQHNNTDDYSFHACSIVKRPQGGYGADYYVDHNNSGKTVPMAILGQSEWIEGLSNNNRTELQDPNKEENQDQ